MRLLLTSVFCFLMLSLFAFRQGEGAKPKSSSKKNIFKQNCAQATAQSELNVNNVRATLLVGGDLWWNGSSGGYIVPQVEPGEPEVSSLFAGAVWIGGLDPAGNLKLAAQQFGTSAGNSDYWPGPIDQSSSTTQQEVCRNWDRIFSVRGEEIDLHLAQFAQSEADNVPYDVTTIPDALLEWPALGNEYFFDIFGFELPDAPQGLAPFWDENGDGMYTPQFGDYPIIEIRGCSSPTYADGMEYWIFNDVGNVHTESGADPLGMEIQAQSFAYATDDAINDMTFTRYKLVNRAQESLEQAIFGVWVDADLGCSEDDYIGCDTIRNMMYIYNIDAVDGDIGSNCNGVSTYGNEIPYLGIDFFRGPLGSKKIDANGDLVCPALGEPFDTIVELGMSSFIYFNRQSATTNGMMTDPNTPLSYYNFLNGTWADGTPMTIGGNGFGGTEVTKFAFHDEPNNPDGWSMCSENLQHEDRRTLQSTGPFRLDPGQVNELIIGIPWVPDVRYPCPDMGRLFHADDLAQSLFDNCFDQLDGPDAPDLELISSDRKLIGFLTNSDITSNNRREEYEEVGSTGPPNFTDEERTYKFEGYIVYQLLDQDVTQADLDDPEKARVAFQSDRENEVVEIFNWERVENPNAGPFENPFVQIPFLQVEGDNEGVRTSFELTTDLFSGERFVNEESYHYMAIAYAYNEFEPFDPVTERGQDSPYLEGRRNVKRYSAIPTGIANQDELPEYGDQPIVTRLDGQGAGSNFLSITNEERDRIFEAQAGILPSEYNGSIVYKRGRAPILVQVIDPLNLIEGQYILRFDQEDDLEFGQSAWELFDGVSNQSLGRANQNLENQNEQIFEDLGISITVNQTADAGDITNEKNGAIGQTITYADPDKAWFTAVPDNTNAFQGLDMFDLHFQATAPGEPFSALDPSQSFTSLGTGHFAPYTLMDWNLRDAPYITPAWLFPTSGIAQLQNPLEELNNVDVVFTNDKSKWSRCVVIETGNSFFTEAGFDLDDEKENFDVVDRPSVGKEDVDGEGFGLAWFPGYAIDVETGTRLNLFFGENSAYGDNTGGALLLESINGSDMMFNPSAQATMDVEPGGELSPFNSVLGGMHYVYVTRQPYDECEFINEKLNEALTFRRTEAVSLISWAAIGLGASDVPLLSYQEGLIPTETVVSLRVDNPYNTSLGTNDNASFPSYGFEIDNETITSTASPGASQNQLDEIRVYPNPVQSSSNVSIKNIPGQSIVTIYSMHGILVKQFEVDGDVQAGQSSTIEWNLRNASGNSVNSGAYLIHVQTEGLGERVLKLICIK